MRLPKPVRTRLLFARADQLGDNDRDMPPVIPVDRNRKHPVVELVAPMEASAPAPTNRPSTIVSTMLYISWKIPPIIIGTAKRTQKFCWIAAGHITGSGRTCHIVSILS